MNQAQSAAPANFSPKQLAPYQNASVRRSVMQLVNSVLPYLACWVVMAQLVQISFWWSLLLAPIAAGFLVRVFIIFHDCGHGSFFRSRRASEIVGFWTGVLTLTPHHQWWREHALHHASSGNLDKRGVGDIWTMSVAEWEQATRWTKLCYWFVRHPAFMLTVGPFVMFAVLNRFPARSARRKERMGVLMTNLALAGLVTAVILVIGWKAYLMIHLPIVLFSGAAGIWLFYVQHQFEGVYWERNEKWDLLRASIDGSSYYRLPRALQWFSGNIGFHHIHHLAPRIPNYELERCHHEVPAFAQVSGIGWRESLRCMQLRLWDEERGVLVGFDALRRKRFESTAAQHSTLQGGESIALRRQTVESAGA
jgi:acyl-lipid omega-6 desaturase (Delta-12 desaturase)